AGASAEGHPLQSSERPGGCARELPHARVRADGGGRQDACLVEPGQQPDRGSRRALAGELGEDALRPEGGRREGVVALRQPATRHLRRLAIKGELVTETFDYDGGRQVTAYVPAL